MPFTVVIINIALSALNAVGFARSVDPSWVSFFETEIRQGRFIFDDASISVTPICEDFAKEDISLKHLLHDVIDGLHRLIALKRLIPNEAARCTYLTVKVLLTTQGFPLPVYDRMMVSVNQNRFIDNCRPYLFPDKVICTMNLLISIDGNARGRTAETVRQVAKELSRRNFFGERVQESVHAFPTSNWQHR